MGYKLLMAGLMVVAVLALAFWPQEADSTATYHPSTPELVILAFPDAPIMHRVAWAESKFDPKAKNPSSTASGVFQILSGTWAHYKCVGDVFEASDNIACARRIYDREGTRPWNASKHVWDSTAPLSVYPQ